MPLDIKKYGIAKKKKIDWLKIFKLKIFYVAFTNLKLYNRWVKIQYIKHEKEISRQKIEEKEKLEVELKKGRIKKFAIRRKPKLLNLYKNLRSMRKRLLEFFKPKLIFILKVLMWLVLLMLIFLIFSYDYEKPDFWAVVSIYMWIIINHYIEENNYKNWQMQAECDEFYQIFCQRWQPHIIINLLVIFGLALKFCDTFGLIIGIIFVYFVDLWNRQFITSDIKQDLILSKLKKYEQSHINTNNLF